MPAELLKLILDLLKKKKSITTADLVGRTGFSRAYVHRQLKTLKDEGKIVLIGRADRARYVPASKKAVEIAKSERLQFLRKYRNKNLQEDLVLDQIISQTGIIYGTAGNIMKIVSYAFTEMLNNAIDHSNSVFVKVWVIRTPEEIKFTVADTGIGIFRKIKEQRGLRDEKEAIQDLLKGKQTTAPDKHSGEGIFFTSRVADRLVIKSSGTRIIFDNTIHDVVIDKTTVRKGTAVEFSISLASRTELKSKINKYAGDEHEFSRTEVKIAMYKSGRDFISRSQARRLLTGLETFKHLFLDFKNVRSIGQGFADEIFRVWKRNHPDAVIEILNANENVKIVIAHVKSGSGRQ